jgi:hypothetical protein
MGKQPFKKKIRKGEVLYPGLHGSNKTKELLICIC